jgi:hypothetical protein
MSVTLTSREFVDRLRPSSSVDWSLFSVGDTIVVKSIFEVFTSIFFTTPAPLVTGNGNQQLFNSSGKFASFSTGDIIKISGPTGYFNTDTIFTIINKLNNNTIIVSLSNMGNPLPVSLSFSDVELNNLTEIKDIRYDFNLIENSESLNFNSKIDGSIQTLTASNVHLSSLFSPVLMVQQGNNEWKWSSNLGIINSCYRMSYNSGNGKQVFKITHTILITPIFLASQYNDFQQGIAPNYFLNANCLKYVYRFSGMTNLFNPNMAQIGQSLNEIGNSGWGNEIFNGGASKFEITNVVFKLGSSVQPNIILAQGTGQFIEFDIESSTSEMASGMKMTVGMIKCPNNDSEYQNNGRYMDENFLFQLIGGFANGGDNYATGFSYDNFTIQKFNATFINANKVHVVISLNIGAGAFAIMQESPIPRFLFYATVSNPALTLASNQNKEVCWTEIYDYQVIKTPSSIDINQTYKRHYEDAADAGIAGKITTFKNDECVMESLISGDFAEIPAVGEANLTNIIQQIVAIRADGNEFIIEDWQLPFTAIWQQGNPFMNYTTNRVFRIPQSEIRKPITIQTVNIGGDWKYKVSYPFMIRWENWIQLITANSDFFNPAQQQNGQNQDWEHYQDFTWKIYFRSSVDGVSEGGSFSFSKDILIEINDYATNPDYSAKTIETFNLAGTQLFAGGTNFIQSFAPTVVKATFAKAAGLLVANSRIVFGIEIYEQGGINGRVRYSSVWETTNPLTWFIPFSGSADKVVISQVNPTTVEARAVLDHNLLPAGNFTYSIVARIYEVPAPINPEDFKKMEDGTYKLMEDGTQKILE